MRPLTRLCFLNSTSPMEARYPSLPPLFLETCLPLLWSPPFPLHAHALISLTKGWPSLTLTLPPYDLMHGQMAVTFLPTAFSGALRPLFPFQQAQYAQVCTLKPAPFCTLLAAPLSLPLPFFSYLTLVLFSPLCALLHLSFYLKLSSRNGLLSPSVLSGYNGSPDTRFSRRATRLMSWPDGECYTCPLVFIIFSRTGSVLSHLNCLTDKFSRLLQRNLCFVVMLAVFSLVLLSSYLCRISRIENPSCSACGHYHLILHCPATNSLRCSLFGDSLSLYF